MHHLLKHINQDITRPCPYIMGTNVIREYSRLQSAEGTIPEAWHVAFKSLAQHVGFVEITSKWCLKPWEVKDVFCL